LPGELYVNWADSQLGVINAASANQDLIPVRFFSTTANYSVGNFVVQAGQLYRATQAVTAGAFNASQWTQVGGSVSVGDTLPTNPQSGGLWWDSVGGNLYVYYNDGNSTQWVPATNLTGSASLTTSDTPPATPKAGDMWFDSIGGQLYIYFNDGNSLQWVIANNFNGGFYQPLKGVTDGSNALPGQIGEYLVATQTTPQGLTNGTPGAAVALSLPAGDWDVWLDARFTGQTATTVAYILASITNSATASNQNPGCLGLINAFNQTLFSSGVGSQFTVGPTRMSITGAAQTWYLGAQAGFGAGTCSAYGSIMARRVR
jgi:hypothetical protein